MSKDCLFCKIAAGENPGPLAGIPFTVKDIFCVKGTPSTAASRILANFTAIQRILFVHRQAKDTKVDAG